MTDETPDEAKRQAAVRFGRRTDWIIALVIMALAVVFIVMLRSLPQRATFFPWFITISIMLVGGFYALTKLRKPDIWDALYDPYGGPDQGIGDTGPAFLVHYGRGILKWLAIFLAVILGAILIGPKYAVPVFVAAALWLGGENKILALASGVAFWMVIHFVFGQAMSINLPIGALMGGY